MKKPDINVEAIKKWPVTTFRRAAAGEVDLLTILDHRPLAVGSRLINRIAGIVVRVVDAEIKEDSARLNRFSQVEQ